MEDGISRESISRDIAEFLNKLDIKKARIGGFDRESVYSCMQDLCDKYEEKLDQLENKFMRNSMGNDMFEALKEENRELKNKLSMGGQPDTDAIEAAVAAAKAESAEEL